MLVISEMKNVVIRIAQDYTVTPGPRFKTDGQFSGQHFRETVLQPLFADPSDEREIHVYLDGVLGYPTSFGDEAFGEIARLYGVERALKRFRFFSSDESLIEEMRAYIEDAVD